ncbi:MAG TPA: MFS transporter, partial [Opitutaceae bacterium]|nr:MFS transporter [Opitutaceae bacterium]
IHIGWMPPGKFPLRVGSRIQLRITFCPDTLAMADPIPPPDAQNPGDADSLQGAAGKKIWIVGTLTYSSGALAVLFGWLLWGDFSWQLKERSAIPVVQIMLKTFKSSDFLAGLFLATLPALIGIVIQPVISYRSDRHRGKWGRRIPYLLLTTPVATVSMFGLAFSPHIGAWIHGELGLAPDSLNFAILMVMGLCWTVFEFATLAANVVFGALINDVVPRQIIGRFFGMFRVVSLLTGIFFNYFLMGKVEGHFTIIFTVLGAVYGLGFTLMCLFVKEGDYPPPPQPVPGEKRGFGVAVRSYCRECFTRPYYVWSIASMGLAMVAFLPVNMYSVFAAKSFNLSMDAYGKYLAVTYAFSIMLAMPLGWLADRFHATRVGLAALGVYTVVMLFAFAGVHGPQAFGIFFLLHGVLSGCYFTGAAALGQMLFPKIKYAQFASAAVAAQALFTILLGPVLGGFLDLMHHDYRYVFAAGALISFAAFVSGYVVYRGFLRYGGPRGYQAPD